jgi:ABC-type dipeptide/oligopeptide/nickel transport system ATPase component
MQGGYKPMPYAFHTGEQPREDRNPVSKVVWDEICEYNSAYNTCRYTSPYNSIIGPSGVGKSFCMRSIVAANHAYVI